MKQTKSPFDALAFANVGNFAEFQALLDKTGARPSRERTSTQAKATQQRCAIVTSIRGVRSA